MAKLGLNAGVIASFGVGQLLGCDERGDDALGNLVGDFDGVAAGPASAALTDAGLTAGGGRAITIIDFLYDRRIDALGDLAQPATTVPPVDAGCGDNEAGERGIGEGKHLNFEMSPTSLNCNASGHPKSFGPILVAVRLAMVFTI
jgi:hypothetical protein